jgi:hypothetical protein
MTSETGNSMPFQRHCSPGPEISAENGKNALFSLNLLLKTVFLPFSAIFNIPFKKFYLTFF